MYQRFPRTLFPPLVRSNRSKSFTRPSFPQGGLWKNSSTDQLVDDPIHEVSDDSPRDVHDKGKRDGDTKLALSTDPISEFSGDIERPVASMPSPSIETAPGMPGFADTRPKEPQSEDLLGIGCLLSDENRRMTQKLLSSFLKKI